MNNPNLNMEPFACSYILLTFHLITEPLVGKTNQYSCLFTMHFALYWRICGPLRGQEICQ